MKISEGALFESQQNFGSEFSSAFCLIFFKPLKNTALNVGSRCFGST